VLCAMHIHLHMFEIAYEHASRGSHTHVHRRMHACMLTGAHLDPANIFNSSKPPLIQAMPAGL